MSCSGGEAALVADLALDRKLEFPPFASTTAARVAATLSDYVAIDNPLDYHTFIWGNREKLTDTFAPCWRAASMSACCLEQPTAPNINTAAGSRRSTR